MIRPALNRKRTGREATAAMADGGMMATVIARSKIQRSTERLDCFAALAMTVEATLRLTPGREETSHLAKRLA
jgi:hypothetical protein